MVARFAAQRDVPRAYATSLRGALRERERFAQVEAFCAFVGHPRSGHTLVGSLLNAHPDVVIANELDVLRFVRWGFSRSQLYAMILEHDRRWGAHGRLSSGYDYTVAGQWQGRHRRLRVIGDKKGGGSTRKLARRPHLLERLRATVGVPLRFVHVVRDPYDNITTWARRSGRPLEAIAENYFSMAETIRDVRRGLREDEIVEVTLESLVADPEGVLTRLCAALGLAPDAAYTRACAGIVFDAPRRTRSAARWDPRLAAHVRQRMLEFDALRSYADGS